MSGDRLLGDCSGALTGLGFPMGSTALARTGGRLRRKLSNLLSAGLPRASNVSGNALLMNAPTSSGMLSNVRTVAGRVSNLNSRKFLVGALGMGKAPYAIVTTQGSVNMVCNIFRFLQLLRARSSVGRLGVARVPGLREHVLGR